MKPSRGSEKASTQRPKSSAWGRKRGQEKPSQDAGPSKKAVKEDQQKGSEPQKGQPKRRGKVKGQEKWKLLPKTSITALGSMLDLSALSVLTMRKKDKEEFQRYLNLLKDRFLASCVDLKVPPRKQGDIIQGFCLCQAESKKNTVGKKTLQTLEGEVNAIVKTLEEMEMRMKKLEQNRLRLRAQLEEEEERIQEILQRSEQGVLNLPPFPPQTAPELPLQEQMAGMVKDPSTAAHLAGMLHCSLETQELRAFLELAHLQADQLLLTSSHRWPSVATWDVDSDVLWGPKQKETSNSRHPPLHHSHRHRYYC
ncbi:centromere protein Q isoform X2 [Megalops cyprinoides]|uniref:centromere protein Q isoform X2 n=1 Tax=Megalops cyprinoides TaxID=118141 RepID=UPI001863E8BD|nr:centromere protein Q isoform X2 [Megalops cyprinoides]